MPTPIRANKLHYWLEGYHDQNYLVEGFKNGFTVGWQGVEHQGAQKNSRIAENNPAIVLELLEKEISLGRISGPYDTPPFQDT